MELYGNFLFSLPWFECSFFRSLSYNSLKGIIPPLSNLRKLKYLYRFRSWTFCFLITSSSSSRHLESNQLDRYVPSWVCDITEFDLRANLFSCPNPTCCGQTPTRHCGVCNPLGTQTPTPPPISQGKQKFCCYYTKMGSPSICECADVCSEKSSSYVLQFSFLTSTDTCSPTCSQLC